MTRSIESPFRAAVRRFMLGSGPLKRGSDRVQMLARLAVVLAFLAAPPLAVYTATRTGIYLDALAAAQATDRQQASATLLEDAPGPQPDWTGDGTPPVLPARVGWSTAATGPHEGMTMVAPGTPAGTVVPVWVDDAGRLAAAPIDPRSVPGRATTMALLPLFGLPLVAWSCYAVLCFALDARRDRRWTRGWAAVEPGWGAQLP